MPDKDAREAVTPSTVYYFVDTNLFFQCRPLEQLAWAELGTCDEVQLIVSKPVLREIDFRKNKGNNRVAKRARAALAMFRKMLDSGHREIQPSDPRVTLWVNSAHTYSPAPETGLNYRERDDQLVATALEYSCEYPDRDVRLLTHDTTPLYTAQGLRLEARQIPDSWLLPPESTAAERELDSLKAEHARLKKTEPSISIRCMGPSNSGIERYEASRVSCEPLTDRQVHELMQQLEDRFPLETDYGSRESAQRASKETALMSLFGTKDVFSPATDEEIAAYRDKAYPQWLLACQETFRNHHRALLRQSPRLEFSFLVENVGTRPATEALVTIEARGSFRIQPPSLTDVLSEDKPENTESHALRPPPVAPKGKWQRLIGGHPPGLGEAMESFARLLDAPLLDKIQLPSPNALSTRHDPNAFYYKPHRPARPSASFSLECDQWRHGGEERINGKIHVPIDKNQIKGALVCRIQAGNLSKPESKTVPVRIGLTRISTFDSAQSMLETLVERSQSGIGSG